MTNLKPYLERVYQEFHRPEFLSSDPLGLVHERASHPNRELYAVFAALLAYGNVQQIRKGVLEAIGRVETDQWEGFRYRFNSGEDLRLLAKLVRKSQALHGSLGQALHRHRKDTDSDFAPALEGCFREWEGWARDEGPSALRIFRGSFQYFITPPSRGSVCKRWCMLFRWMVRKDALDLGWWGKWFQPHELVMPLDTHTGRLVQYLGLTERKTLNWKVALEVTQGLKSLDPEDPVRFDFSLARLGILDRCEKRFRVDICTQCVLLPVCKFAKQHTSL